MQHSEALITLSFPRVGAHSRVSSPHRSVTFRGYVLLGRPWFAVTITGDPRDLNHFYQVSGRAFLRALSLLHHQLTTNVIHHSHGIFAFSSSPPRGSSSRSGARPPTRPLGWFDRILLEHCTLGWSRGQPLGDPLSISRNHGSLWRARRRAISVRVVSQSTE